MLSSVRKKLIEIFLIFFSCKIRHVFLIFLHSDDSADIAFFSQGVVIFILASIIWSWLQEKKSLPPSTQNYWDVFWMSLWREIKNFMIYLCCFLSTAKKSLFHFARIFLFFHPHQHPLSRRRHNVMWKLLYNSISVDLFVRNKLFEAL